MPTTAKGVSMPCVRRFTFGGAGAELTLQSLTQEAFQCRASGVSHSEVIKRCKQFIDNYVSMPCVRRFTFGAGLDSFWIWNSTNRFNAVRPAFHIRRPRKRCWTRCTPSFRFNAVRPAFHIRRGESSSGNRFRATFQCRASGVSHSEKNETRKHG